MRRGNRIVPDKASNVTRVVPGRGKRLRAANDPGMSYARASKSWRFLGLWLMAMVAVITIAAIYVTFKRSKPALYGVADIIDGDTIKIHGQTVRLEGIDTPEPKQTCVGEGGKQVACGGMASSALGRVIGGQSVNCEVMGRDGFDRILGECSVNGESINAHMVREGWALAFVKYSRRFVSEEEQARAAKVGIWQWQFEKPWDWRARISREAVSQVAEPSGCVIKGNISRKGEKIYHMPFQTDYERTGIDESKGERWFCTEGEARSAGWRRALR